MAGLRLLDTNAMIALNLGQLPVDSADAIAISFITRLELLSWPGANESQLDDLRGMVDAVDTIPMTEAIEEVTIKLRSARLLKLPDAIVAATAMTLDAELVTNDREFSKVEGLRLSGF